MKILTVQPAQKAVPQAFFPCMLVVEVSSIDQLKKVVQPLYNVQHIEGVVVITGSDELFQYCSHHSLHAVRETHDPLANLYTAAKAFDLEVIVRVRGVLEADAIDRALFYFRSHFDELDYAQLEGGILEIIRFDALEEAFYHSKERVNFEKYLMKHFRAAQFEW